MDDEIVMESTTDSPEAVAEGLGIELRATDEGGNDTGETQVPETEPEPQATITEPETTESLEVSAEPVVATVKAKPAKKRKPTSSATTLEEHRELQAQDDAEKLRIENAELKRRLAAGERDEPPATIGTTKPDVVLPPVEAVKPSEIGDDHPDIADLNARRLAIGAEPKQEDFPDFDEFSNKRRAWDRQMSALDGEETFIRRDAAKVATKAREDVARQTAELEQNWTRSKQAARARYKDYDAVMEAAAGTLITPLVKQALLESERGGELIYYFAKNPIELRRVQGMTPARSLLEIGRIEARLGAAPRSGRVTAAPEPPTTQLGGSGGSPKPENLETVPYSEYKRIRREQNIAAGRSDH